MLRRSSLLFEGNLKAVLAVLWLESPPLTSGVGAMRESL